MFTTVRKYFKAIAEEYGKIRELEDRVVRF